jgi:hypothetical protein
MCLICIFSVGLTHCGFSTSAAVCATVPMINMAPGPAMSLPSLLVTYKCIYHDLGSHKRTMWPRSTRHNRPVGTGPLLVWRSVKCRPLGVTWRPVSPTVLNTAYTSGGRPLLAIWRALSILVSKRCAVLGLSSSAQRQLP